MDFATLANRLSDKFGDAVVCVNSEALDPWIEVAAEQWLSIAQSLHDDEALAFDYLNCISGVDYLHTDPKQAAKVDWQPHIEVVYHLSSLRLRHRLVVKIKLPRWNPGSTDQLPQVPSVAQVWRTADWHEREVYDLMGVEFTGHPNLCRILCPEDWAGHPLRKDYEMPLEYHGIRGR